MQCGGPVHVIDKIAQREISAKARTLPSPGHFPFFLPSTTPTLLSVHFLSFLSFRSFVRRSLFSHSLPWFPFLPLPYHAVCLQSLERLQPALDSHSSSHSLCSLLLRL